MPQSETQEAAPQTKVDSPKWWTSFKTWLEIAQGIFTIGAIIGAAFWFFKQESLKPQIKLEQTCTQRRLAGEKGNWLVIIDVKATNVGKVKVILKQGEMHMDQINPLPGRDDLEVAPLRELELVPGEQDVSLFKSYIIPDDIRTLEFTSSYPVPGRSEVYWMTKTSMDIGEESGHPVARSLHGDKP